MPRWLRIALFVLMHSGSPVPSHRRRPRQLRFWFVIGFVSAPLVLLVALAAVVIALFVHMHLSLVRLITEAVRTALGRGNFLAAAAFLLLLLVLLKGFWWW